ncbi:MAG: HAD-IA family hydrolase [Muribaculaceae bacterium]|nr:HAD-IA family hydrolase [Muribaculaceae bacterium]
MCNAIKDSAQWGALFDLDGVLVDSEGIYTRFWHDIDLRYPTGVPNFEYVIKGNTLRTILDTYFADGETRASIVEALKEHEANMEYVLFEGVVDFLSLLRETGIVSAIVTSSNSSKMRHLFAELPLLRSLVDEVVTEDDVSYSKPHPQGYNVAASRLGLSPRRCIVFEDSMAGVEAGRRAGGAVVGVATTNPAERLLRFADVVVNRVADFDITTAEELLDSLNR